MATVAPSVGQSLSNPITFDMIGDSRMADVFVSACNGSPRAQCGFSATNWFVQASALAGQRYQVGVNQASSGCRTDQYLSSANFAPILASKDLWLIIGYPAVNDIGAAGTGCPISPGGGSYPYTNANGVVVTLSNVASVAAGNILSAVQQAVTAGKKVILSKEPGSVNFNTTPSTVSSFNGQTSTFTLTVNSMTSGTIYPGSQTLAGSGVTASTLITAQLTGTGGAACPDPTCNGGVGTYSISTSQTISAEAMTGTYTTLAALYELNSDLDAIAAAFPGQVFLFDSRPALWNFVGSATAVTFKSGILLDNTLHYNVLGGYYGGIAFNSFFQSIIPASDYSIASIDNLFPNNPRSLINNPLFQTASGGANTTCTLASGTVPAGYTEGCNSASTSVTITQATDTDMLYGSAAIPLGGNAVKIAITSTGADAYHLDSNAPAVTRWNLTDWFQGSMIVNVAAGSSHCTVYADNQISSNVGTRESYAMYGGSAPTGGGINDGPTTSYTYLLRTPPAQVIPASTTKGFLRFRLIVSFSAAGNCVVTVSRESLNRVRVYDPVSGTFTGWLLMRDIKGGSDNTPVWLKKAA